jgi:Family of unknown function (DUF6339)
VFVETGIRVTKSLDTNRRFTEVHMWLYPRLPHTVAKKLAQERVSMSIQALRKVSDVKHSDTVYAPTGGNRVEPSHLEAIRRSMLRVAEEAGFPSPVSENKKRNFDAASGEILYRDMEISPADASESGAWQFIACVMLPELVRWRFPGGQGGTNIERMLGGVRNTFQRVWWRAHILNIPQETEDPFKLLKLLGEDELVQIMERPSIAGSPKLAQAICRTFLDTISRIKGIERMRLMRDAQKRLMRLSSFISFDALDEELLRTLLGDVFREAVASVKHGFSK